MEHTPRPTCDDCEATWYRGGSLKAIVPCKLHAAAPALLSALEAMTEARLKSCVAFADCESGFTAALELARAAILAAKGEA